MSVNGEGGSAKNKSQSSAKSFRMSSEILESAPLVGGEPGETLFPRPSHLRLGDSSPERSPPRLEEGNIFIIPSTSVPRYANHVNNRAQFKKINDYLSL